jgi:hypothetical protein
VRRVAALYNVLQPWLPLAWLGAGKELVTDQEKLNDATLYVQSLLELKDKSVHAAARRL